MNQNADADHKRCCSMHLGAHDAHCQTAYPYELYHCRECYAPVLGRDLVSGVCFECRKREADAYEYSINI